jgi:hypothetical protein
VYASGREGMRMPRKGRKKIKDLVDMLEDPDTTYIGGDYEDIADLLEKNLTNEEDEENQEENKEGEE